MTIDAETLLEDIKTLPGYDPYRDAEDYEFDAETALFAIEFVETCCHFTKGEAAGKPFLLERWQRAIVALLFGWYHRETGRRRYREGLIYVPRKNGKTELLAAIGLLVLFCDQEPGAENIAAASKFEQAHQNLFTAALRMIEFEPEMQNRCETFRKVIQFNGSFWRCTGSNAAGEHGGSTHFAVIDELHALPTRELVDVIKTATMNRKNSLIIYTTTADYDRVSICNEIYDIACKVRDGAVRNPQFLPVVYEATKTDDWRDLETWKKANPNFGVSVDAENFAKMCQDAIDNPATLNTFLRLHLNRRTEQLVRMIRMDHWDQCDLPLRYVGKRECWGGLDLATIDDLAAAVLIFPDDRDGTFDVLAHFWSPLWKAEERQRSEYTPYLTWARQGWITLTERRSIDFGKIEETIRDWNRRYNLQAIGYDTFGSGEIKHSMENEGIVMEAIRQRWDGIGPPAKVMLRGLADGRFRFGKNPVLRWMAGNAAGKEDAGQNIMPVKDKSGDKIDGIMALCMAIAMTDGRHETEEAPGISYA